MKFHAPVGANRWEIMATADEYERYAEHCLKIVGIAESREDRIIQREMATEWLRLAAELRITKAYTKLVDAIGASHDHGADQKQG
jgi:hypothetical protein